MSKNVIWSQLWNSLLSDPVSQGGEGIRVRLEQIKTHLSFIRKESSPTGEPGTASFQHAQCQVNFQREAHAWLGDTVVSTWGRTMALPQAAGSLLYSVHCDADWSLCGKLPISPRVAFPGLPPPVLMEMTACPGQNTVPAVPRVTRNHSNSKDITCIVDCCVPALGQACGPAYGQVTDRWEHHETAVQRELGKHFQSVSQRTSCFL